MSQHFRAQGSRRKSEEAAPAEQGFSLLTFHSRQRMPGSGRPAQCPINAPLSRRQSPTMQPSEPSITSPRTDKFWRGRTRAPLSEGGTGGSGSRCAAADARGAGTGPGIALTPEPAPCPRRGHSTAGRAAPCGAARVRLEPANKPSSRTKI